MLSIAGLLGILVYTKGNIQAANAGIMTRARRWRPDVAQLLARYGARGHSVGFALMTEAGFAPAGMVSMFERTEQAYHLMDSGAYPDLRSHR